MWETKRVFCERKVVLSYLALKEASLIRCSRNIRHFLSLPNHCRTQWTQGGCLWGVEISSKGKGLTQVG